MNAHNVMLALLVAGFLPTASASNIVNTIGDWLHDHNGNGTLTIKEEIQCYSLPYGGIGKHLEPTLSLCLVLGGLKI